MFISPRKACANILVFFYSDDEGEPSDEEESGEEEEEEEADDDEKGSSQAEKKVEPAEPASFDALQQLDATLAQMGTKEVIPVCPIMNWHLFWKSIF